MFADRFKARLSLQAAAGLLRNPPEVSGREGKYLIVGSRKVLNFASNDYLGLGNCDALKRAAAASFERYGTSSSSSRLVSGNYSAIAAAEKRFAEYFGYADALFFPSGYQANLGVLSAFFRDGDTIVFDKHIHNSSVKGMVMGGARFYGFNHADLKHLEKRLKTVRNGQTAVLTEALYSMDGDLLDTAGLKRVKEQYNCLAVVDEAHSFGALGSGGRGIAHGVADIAVGTLGKAFGLFGAFALLPQGFKEYLFNFSAPLIYSTTLPEAHAATAVEALKIVEAGDDRRARLAEASAAMKEGLRQKGFRVSGDAHILALEIGEEARSAALAKHLLDQDIFVLPARYPTVPMGRAILRISMTAMHEKADTDLFARTVMEGYEKIDKVR